MMKIDTLKNLPKEAKNVWVKSYDLSIKKGKSKSESALMSWRVIKKLYTQKSNKSWVKTSKTSIKKSLLQSVLNSQPTYFLEGSVDLGTPDLEGYKVSESLIEKLSNPNLFENYASIEHSEFNKDLNIGISTTITKGLEPYTLLSKKLEGETIKVKFKLNNDYPDFNNLVKKSKEGHLLNISPEFKGVVTFGNLIVDADKIGWSFTDYPKQPNNKVYLKENGRK